MINNSEFAERLRRIMDYYQVSASSFADRIQVQRSSISHLLSGRNKPSLDFVMRVVKEFDEVELYWLLNGKGTFPSTDTPAVEATPPTVQESKPQESNPQELRRQELQSQAKSSSSEKSIERIVVFFKDGTFKAYLP